MMKHRVLALLSALLVLLACAALAETELPADLEAIDASAFEGDAALTGVVVLPQSVQTVGSRAFAATGVHALLLPEGCTSLAADVLAGGQAAYVLMNGTETAVSADALTDVPLVFASAGSGVTALPGFYPTESLVVEDGWYYSVSDGEAIPLCAVDGTAVTGTVTLPKTVNGQPILSLEALVTKGCSGMTALQVPAYLLIPDGLAAEHYQSIKVTEPIPSVTEVGVGDKVTWTTSVTGAYGDVAYIWSFDVDGVYSSVITAEPTVTWAPTTEGTCVASVTAVDELNDGATAKGAGVTVGPAVPVYRALLIGNVYAGQENALDGCDTDAAAMRTMLSSMTGTEYAVTSYIDITASGMQSAISSTFADARSCDVSLFYYSGHGTSAGSLVGMGNSTVSVSTLRSWLDQIPGTKIVIIDACYSGAMINKSEGSTSPSAFTSAFISGFSAFNKDDLATNGYIVMTACSKDQFSQSLSDGTIAFGAFTYGVCYGSGFDEWNQTALGSMPADTDGNGQITLGEAYTTAVEQIEWFATMVEMDQSAQYYGDTSYVLWSK